MRRLTVLSRSGAETDEPVLTSACALPEGCHEPVLPDVCGRCFGVGIEVVAGKGARPCRCRDLELRRRLWERAQIPRRFEQSSLANYVPDEGAPSQLRAFAQAFRLATAFPSVDRGLLFSGPVGVGKTHLSVGILRALVEKGVPSLFFEFGALLKLIQGTYNQAAAVSEMQVLAPVIEVEALVLDELGATRPTEWVRDMLMLIVNARYNACRLTIFTTNYSDASGFDGMETLEDRVGVRLRSRLREMCRTVFIAGEDYRQKYDRD
jgi:DNA replication protein DnaC